MQFICCRTSKIERLQILSLGFFIHCWYQCSCIGFFPVSLCFLINVKFWRKKVPNTEKPFVAICELNILHFFHFGSRFNNDGMLRLFQNQNLFRNTVHLRFTATLRLICEIAVIPHTGQKPYIDDYAYMKMSEISKLLHFISEKFIEVTFLPFRPFYTTYLAIEFSILLHSTLPLWEKLFFIRKKTFFWRIIQGFWRW